MTQGLMRSAAPMSMSVDPTLHETLCFQSSKFKAGKSRQDTRGFLKLSQERLYSVEVNEINKYYATHKLKLYLNITYKNGSGRSNDDLCSESTVSQLSHSNLERVTFLISVSWESVNLTRGSEFSYQKRSHFLKFLNWIPIMQPNVGPKSPPWRGVSTKPPVNKSISSTWSYVLFSLSMMGRATSLLRSSKVIALVRLHRTLYSL